MRIILFMRPANERHRYNVMSSLIGWAHTQNDPCGQFYLYPRRFSRWYFYACPYAWLGYVEYGRKYNKQLHYNITKKSRQSCICIYGLHCNWFDLASIVASWMYLYASSPTPPCQLSSLNQPSIVYRRACYLMSKDTPFSAWIKLIIARPVMRSLIVTFVGLNISCSLADGTSVLVRYHDGNHGGCMALWDNQATEKQICTYRCSCIKGCTYVAIGTVGKLQQEICNVSYSMT